MSTPDQREALSDAQRRAFEVLAANPDAWTRCRRTTSSTTPRSVQAVSARALVKAGLAVMWETEPGLYRVRLSRAERERMLRNG
jgi:hypothetical protein